MLNYYTGVLKNYAGFGGRARRAEYWQFALVNTVAVILLDIVGAVIHFPFLGILYVLATLVPSLAAGVRRLHDTDRSGWWLLIALVPLVGGIILLVFTCTAGQQGPNKYGPDPKAPVGAQPNPAFAA